MPVCDAHGAVHRSEREMQEGEGYLLAAKFVQRSVIQEKLINRDMAYMETLGVTREEYRLRLEALQGYGPWLVCDDCIGVLNLSQEDLNAARQASRRWYKDKSCPGHMPQSSGPERDKRPAFILIYGNGFSPSREECALILAAWVDKRKDILGENVGDVRCEPRESLGMGDLDSFLGLKSRVQGEYPRHVIDDMLLVDKRSGSPKHLGLFAIWTPEEMEFIATIFATPSESAGGSQDATANSVGRRKSSVWNLFMHLPRRKKMFRAMKKNCLEEIHSLLEKDPTLAKVSDKLGRTPLVAVMELLARSRSANGDKFCALINAAHDSGVLTHAFCAIPFAFQGEESNSVQENVLHMATQLLKAGANINGTGGKVPLVESVFFCNVWFTQYLLSHGAILLTPDANGTTALDVALLSEKIHGASRHDVGGLTQNSKRIVVLLQEAVGKL